MIQKMLMFLCLSLVSFSFFHFGVEATGNFTSPDFMIDTSTFTVSETAESLNVGTAQQTINTTLGTIIQKMMIGLSIISFVILVIGAGFMILASGEDEYVNRGKSIFTAGISSLIIALLSYYAVALIRFLLFTNK